MRSTLLGIESAPVKSRQRPAPSALWRRACISALMTAICHELIELAFVLRRAKPSEEFMELLFLLFESPQSIRAIFVKRVVSAGAWLPPGSGITHRSDPFLPES